MKRIACFFLILVVGFPVHAQEFNAGFVHGLWYSQEVVFAENPVRIYVAIRNNTGSDMTGTVEFFDNDNRIERVNVSALDGRIIETWADWTPTYGSHAISATLSRTELHHVGSSTKTIGVTASLAEDLLFVDYDTDRDGVGNKDDIDDDGDGISDTAEEKNGTNPLEYDEPAPDPEVSTEEPQVNSSAGSNQASSSNSQGLEQYLTPSRADTMLSGVTQFVHDSKEKLDAYRTKRGVQNGTIEPIVEEIEVNEDGFGEITRTQESPEAEKVAKNIEKPEGFFGDILSFFGAIFGGIYTSALAVVSFYLGHPIFVQLSLLILILLALYKIAQKLGSRPQ